MSGNSDFTIIGGIKFSGPVKASSKQVGVNGSTHEAMFKYKVETQYGTFEFFDQREEAFNSSKRKNKPAEVIFGQNGVTTINNCNLSNITGSSGKDTYKIQDSYVFRMDMSGDPENVDTVILMGDTTLGRPINVDLPNDHVVDLRENDGTINIKM